MDTRIEDKELPQDFSDIKEFKLSGVIELEHELNIIDKLIEKENNLQAPNFDINKIFNKNLSPKRSKVTFDFTNFVKSAEYQSKLKEILERLRQWEAAEKIDIEKMTVEELQAKLFEYHQAEEIKNNTKLLHAIEFVFSLKINTDKEKEVLVNFVKALNDYIKNPVKDKEFPAEILAKVHQIEENFLNEEERKQAKFEWVKGKLTDSINSLYDKGLTFAADIVFNNIPKSADNEQEIRNGVYIIKLIDKLKEEPELSEKDKNLSEEEKAAKIEKLKKLRDIEVENTLIGYDAAASNSEYLIDAVNYSRAKYGLNRYKYIGEYIKHLSNLNNCDFSSYPDFCEDVFLELANLKKEEAVNILIKLQEWKASTKNEKESFTKIFNMFSKKQPIGKEILENYLKNYYVNFDTTITAVGIKDKSLKIPAVLTQKAKEKMVHDIAEHELVDYFEEFEYAMTRIIGTDGHLGIKPYKSNKKTNSRTHEVTVSYPARLYCHKKAFFVFDEFEYDSHKGANS